MEKMSVVNSLFRSIAALALLNSFPFPFLRGSSSPGLSALGLGSLGRKIQKSVLSFVGSKEQSMRCVCRVVSVQLALTRRNP